MSVHPRKVGRYTLFEAIAQGGMAQVHYGTLRGAAGFSRVVAIKGRRWDRDPSDASSAALYDEARLAARIKHTNVVQTLDVIADGGELLLVMEYVHGESLASLVEAQRARGGVVAIDVACAIVAQILRGLHAAHEALGPDGRPLDLVHRDLSPKNVLVDANGCAKVADFGVAKARARMQVTATGELKGTAAYMAPEQVHGESSRRSDVFSVGVVLWELLTGARLFEGESSAETLANVLGKRIERASKRRPEISTELDDVVRRALQRDAERRFATAQEMARALEAAAPLASQDAVGAWVRALCGEALDARQERISTLERSEASTAAAPVAAPSAGPAGSGRRWWLGAIAIGCALVVFVAWPRAKQAPHPAAPSAIPAASDDPEAPPAADPAASISPLVPVPSTPPHGARGAAPHRPPPRDPCSPPFTVDEHGRKVYKRECFPP